MDQRNTKATLIAKTRILPHSMAFSFEMGPMNHVSTPNSRPPRPAGAAFSRAGFSSAAGLTAVRTFFFAIPDGLGPFVGQGGFRRRRQAPTAAQGPPHRRHAAHEVAPHDTIEGFRARIRAEHPYTITSRRHD